VKVTKSDLITTGRIGFVLDVFLFAYVFIASYFPLFVVFVSILRSLSISVGVSFLELTILPGVPSFVIGVVMARKRASFLVGRDFRTVHGMRTINRYLRPIFSGLFFVVSVPLVLAIYGYLKVEVLSLIVVWLVAVEGMAVGVALTIYLGMLAARDLARLYFRYANELKDRSKEVAAIREAFKQLRIDAADYGLELSTSRFEQLLATRLYKGKDVKDELAGLMRHLSDGDPIIVALKELAGDSEDFLALAKIEQEWRSFLEWIGKFVVLVLAPIASAVAVLLLERFL
jgi:hypothetical protein